MTNRDPETAVLITAEKLNAMADSITKSVAVFREAAELALRSESKGIATFSVKSGETAVDRAHAFAKALEKAIYAAKSSQPYIVGELKPRSTAKTKSVSEVQEILKNVPRKKSKG